MNYGKQCRMYGTTLPPNGKYPEIAGSTPKWIPAGLHEKVVTSNNEISLIKTKYN